MLQNDLTPTSLLQVAKNSNLTVTFIFEVKCSLNPWYFIIDYLAVPKFHILPILQM